MEMLNANEMAVVRRLCLGDKTARVEAKVIYLAHVAKHVNGGRKSVAMNFLSEAFNKCPDLMLRGKYRQQVLDQT